MTSRTSCLMENRQIIIRLKSYEKLWRKFFLVELDKVSIQEVTFELGLKKLLKVL